MNPNAMPDWLFTLFPFWFAGIWVGASFMISRIGGWGQLASHYRRNDSISGTTWWFQSAGMRFRMTGHYGSCLIVTANDEGIGLSVLLPFRIAHPPLFIPWSDILASQERWFCFFKRVRLTFSLEQSDTVWISNGLAKKVREAVGQNWFQEIS